MDDCAPHLLANVLVYVNRVRGRADCGGGRLGGTEGDGGDSQHSNRRELLTTIGQKESRLLPAPNLRTT